MSQDMNAPDKSPANASAGKSVAAPAGKPAEVTEARQQRRRPMSVPQRRLEATPIPGYHLHWIREENLNQAYRASYTHVLVNEVEINTRNVAVDSKAGATADLSDRVSVQYGGDTLYLMKLDENLYNEDMALLAERNRQIWTQIFRGEQIAGTAGQNPGDTSHSYLKEAEATGGNLMRARVPLFGRKYK